MPRQKQPRKLRAQLNTPQFKQNYFEFTPSSRSGGEGSRSGGGGDGELELLSFELTPEEKNQLMMDAQEGRRHGALVSKNSISHHQSSSSSSTLQEWSVSSPPSCRNTFRTTNSQDFLSSSRCMSNQTSFSSHSSMDQSSMCWFHTSSSISQQPHSQQPQLLSSLNDGSPKRDPRSTSSSVGLLSDEKFHQLTLNLFQQIFGHKQQKPTQESSPPPEQQ